ncbi:Lipocalin [Mollivirus sibericum]|uniref:Lipocalin n=1 Tax=Mollivirus sibericum TaxID=1678078 RepID=UPI0006B2DBA2|nr:Lipocalin [Mollivirus sibericum]ALD62089.1 Lipocalin [Mollivirus sibericum]
MSNGTSPFPSVFPFPNNDGIVMACMAAAAASKQRQKQAASNVPKKNVVYLDPVDDDFCPVPSPFMDDICEVGFNREMIYYPPADHDLALQSLGRDPAPLRPQQSGKRLADERGPVCRYPEPRPSVPQPQPQPPPESEDQVQARKQREALRRAKPVADFDELEFSGTWYNLGMLRNPLDHRRVRNAKSEYAFCTGSREMGVLNSCVSEDASLMTFHGVAVLVAPGKLWVRPANKPAPPRKEMARGNLWVIYVDKDYKHAIVASPEDACAAIIGRHPCTPAKVTEGLVAKLERLGIDTSQVEYSDNYVLDRSLLRPLIASEPSSAKAGSPVPEDPTKVGLKIPGFVSS